MASGKLNRGEKWYAYAFISPMVLGYAFFLLGPILVALGMSFTDWSLIRSPSFIGWANYEKIAKGDPEFWITVKNTLYFSLWLVPIKIALALVLAMLLKDRIPGIGFFRTMIFTPVVTSIVVWSIIWKYIFETDNGLINSFLKLFGIHGPAWLYDITLAMPAVVFVALIKGVGLTMVIFLAALHDVPQMYYEAARIDGASRWRTFTHVTVPLITPSIFLALIITMISSLKVFGLIYVLTGGGPGTSTYVFVYYIYELAFKIYEFGYSSAVAVILFLLILSLTLMQWTIRKRWVHYEQ